MVDGSSVSHMVIAAGLARRKAHGIAKKMHMVRCIHGLRWPETLNVPRGGRTFVHT